MDLWKYYNYNSVYGLLKLTEDFTEGFIFKTKKLLTEKIGVAKAVIILTITAMWYQEYSLCQDTDSSSVRIEERRPTTATM